MAIKESIECDICTKVKGESNHWFLAKDWLMDGECATERGLVLKPWSNNYRNHLHICGEECAGKLQARMIAEWRQS